MRIWWTCLALGILLGASSWATGEELTSAQCLECHAVEAVTPPRIPSPPGEDLFLLPESVHGGLECSDCHGGVTEEHPLEKAALPRVDCGQCHADEAELLARSVHHPPVGAATEGYPQCYSCHGAHGVFKQDDARSYLFTAAWDRACSQCHEKEEAVYRESLHGTAMVKGDPLAPHCWDCHGSHGILPPENPGSRSNPINVPEMCGACHAENAPVAAARNIAQHDILQHYEESIHGEGLKRKGLTVTAVCSSCHTAHHVLPHTDARSTIHRDNVVKTCMQCHTLIEEVHRKVVEGRLWEEEPNKVPVCIDCHQPHAARKVYYDEGVSDKDCMACHGHAVTGATRVLAAVDTIELASSTHARTRCAQCHTGAQPSLHRPCETIAAKVDCSICHAAMVNDYRRGVHGQLAARGDPDAPECLDCHRGHGTQSKRDPASPTFPRNVPTLCGACHREGERAARRLPPERQHEIVAHYSMSIHGKGLLQSGLVVTAMCSDCHTAHRELPRTDPESTVHPDNVPATCGRCHHGIQEVFETSIHSASVSQTERKLPVCSDCHSAHSIVRTAEEQFVESVIGACGDCHREEAETYRDTYHGKTAYGPGKAAKCYDCHGAHDILPPSDPHSRLSRQNIVATCAQCHRGAHLRFAAGYLTHATHHDPKKYPALFFTFWAMTALLVGTFAFFGLHTLAWLPVSFRELRHRKRLVETTGDQRMFRRFDPRRGNCISS
ncbi:cytochrome c3 family protein [bacterium]|nr:cytochrome c3 family protein [bacterium]